MLAHDPRHAQVPSGSHFLSDRKNSAPHRLWSSGSSHGQVLAGVVYPVLLLQRETFDNSLDPIPCLLFVQRLAESGAKCATMTDPCAFSLDSVVDATNKLCGCGHRLNCSTSRNVLIDLRYPDQTFNAVCQLPSLALSALCRHSIDRVPRTSSKSQPLLRVSMHSQPSRTTTNSISCLPDTPLAPWIT